MTIELSRSEETAKISPKQVALQALMAELHDLSAIPKSQEAAQDTLKKALEKSESELNTSEIAAMQGLLWIHGFYRSTPPDTNPTQPQWGILNTKGPDDAALAIFRKFYANGLSNSVGVDSLLLEKILAHDAGNTPKIPLPSVLDAKMLAPEPVDEHSRFTPLSAEAVGRIEQFIVRLAKKYDAPENPRLKNAQCMAAIRWLCKNWRIAYPKEGHAWEYLNTPWEVEIAGEKHSVTPEIAYRSPDVVYRQHDSHFEIQLSESRNIKSKEDVSQLLIDQTPQIYEALAHSATGNTSIYAGAAFVDSSYLSGQGAAKDYQEALASRASDVSWDEGKEKYANKIRPATHAMYVTPRAPHSHTNTSKETISIMDLVAQTFYTEGRDYVPNPPNKDLLRTIIPQLFPLIDGMKVTADARVKPGQTVTWTDHMVSDFFPTKKGSAYQENLYTEENTIPKKEITLAPGGTSITREATPKKATNTNQSHFRFLSFTELLMTQKIIPVDILKLPMPDIWRGTEAETSILKPS